MEEMGSAANYHVLSIIEYCSRHGLPRQTLLSGTGISETSLKNPYDRQPGDAVLTLWHRAEQLTENPLLALEVGAASTTMQRSSVTTLVEAAPNLKAALQCGLRFQHLTQNIIRSDLHFEQQTGHIVIDNKGLDPTWVRPQIERQIAFVLTLAKNLSEERQGRFNGAYACFSGSPRATEQRYRDLLGIEIRFHCPRNELVFPTSILKLNNFSGNSELQSSLVDVVQQYERDLQSGLGIRAKIRQAIANRLGHAPVGVEQVARQLNISTRTLQRRLHDENTHFSEVYDEVRKQRAIHLIQRPELSITEISYLLGFTHITGFYSAFHRWTGVAPIKFRQSMKATESDSMEAAL